MVVRRVGAAVVVSAAAGLVTVTVAGKAEPVFTQVTAKRFNAAVGGLAFPYEPFDPALGELKRVRVNGDTVFTATGTALPYGSGATYPIQMQFDVNISGSSGQGMSFIGPWTYYFNDAIGPGGATQIPALPVQYIATQMFNFTIDEQADLAGLATINWSSPPLGAGVAPIAVEANLDTFTSPLGAVGSVYAITPMVSPSSVLMNPPLLGGGMIVQYDYVPRDVGETTVDDGGFDEGLDHWQQDGPGHAEPVTENVGQGNTAAQLTTGSPVSISQQVDTPDQAFRIAFDYAFRTAEGELDVQLAGQTLATLASSLDVDLHPDVIAPFEHFSLDVTDDALQGLTDAVFELAFDGPTGSQVLIDNVWVAPITAVPEPGALALLGVAGMAMVTRRRGGKAS